VRRILQHLGLPAGCPQLAPARLPKELGFDFEPDDHCSTETHEAPPSVPPVRGPPASTPGH